MMYKCHGEIFSLRSLAVNFALPRYTFLLPFPLSHMPISAQLLPVQFELGIKYATEPLKS